MRRVQLAAWQMTRAPDDAKGRKYWEESTTWRSDDEWREAYVKLMKDDPRNSTKWKRPLQDVPLAGNDRSRDFLWMLGSRRSRLVARGQSGAP